MDPIPDYNPFSAKYWSLFYAYRRFHTVFVTQIKNGLIEDDMLEQMNELLMEEVEARWDAYGQSTIVVDSKMLKEKYELYKRLFEGCDKKKIPRRVQLWK